MSEAPLICRKAGCSQPAAPEQVYCCRDHAPYGNLGFESRNNYSARAQHRRDLAAQLMRLSKTHTLREAAELLGLAYSTVRECAVAFEIEMYDGYKRRRERERSVRSGY